MTWEHFTNKRNTSRVVETNLFFCCNQCHRLIGNYPPDGGEIIMLDLRDWIKHGEIVHGRIEHDWEKDHYSVEVISKGKWEYNVGTG